MTRVLLPSLLTLLVAAPAQAFSVGTVATTGCHERITLTAAREAGVAPETASVTAEDRALRAALPFHVEGAWDRRTLALLVGLRDNDFHGVPASDFAGLAEVHLSPVLQHEHCLRAPGEDHAGGDVAALARCREFVVNELRLAASAGAGATESVLVALTDRPLQVELPAAEVHLGRALHAVQDGFSHALRDRKFRRVRSVFNYVDPLVGERYQLARDGYRHVSDYDDCDEGPALERAEVAIETSRELIAAVHRAELPVEARVAAAEEVLDEVWGYEPACADGEAWCDEADALLHESLPLSQGCSSAGGSTAWGLAVLVLVATWRRALKALVSRRGAGVLAAALLAVAPGLARAERLQASPAPSSRPGLRAAISLGLSAERGAGMLGLGLRLPTRGRLEFSADVEFNPWFDALAGKVNAGAFNAALGSSLRWASIGGVELRSSVGLGASVLLHDTVGAATGSVGPFLQASVINALVAGPRGTRFEVRPDVVLTVPSLRGVPLVYPQYRLVAALRFD